MVFDLTPVATMAVTLSLENQVLRDFAFYAAILGVKCLIMGLLTVRRRIYSKIFPAKEDYVLQGKPDKPDADAIADIQRVRNAHRNDMENIYPFFALGFIYCFCNPDVMTARWLFRIFTTARICHTIVYLTYIRQPFRGICYGVGQIVNFTLCGLIMKAAITF